MTKTYWVIFVPVKYTPNYSMNEKGTDQRTN